MPMIAVEKKLICGVIYYNFRHTFVPYLATKLAKVGCLLLARSANFIILTSAFIIYLFI